MVATGQSSNCSSLSICSAAIVFAISDCPISQSIFFAMFAADVKDHPVHRLIFHICALASAIMRSFNIRRQGGRSADAWNNIKTPMRRRCSTKWQKKHQQLLHRVDRERSTGPWLAARVLVEAWVGLTP